MRYIIEEAPVCMLEHRLCIDGSPPQEENTPDPQQNWAGLGHDVKPSAMMVDWIFIRGNKRILL